MGKLREFFYDPDDDNNEAINPFKLKSNWAPPTRREPSLEYYMTSVRGVSSFREPGSLTAFCG